jgi:hypothetical protein
MVAKQLNRALWARVSEILAKYPNLDVGQAPQWRKHSGVLGRPIKFIKDPDRNGYFLYLWTDIDAIAGGGKLRPWCEEFFEEARGVKMLSVEWFSTRSGVPIPTLAVWVRRRRCTFLPHEKLDVHYERMKSKTRVCNRPFLRADDATTIREARAARKTVRDTPSESDPWRTVREIWKEFKWGDDVTLRKYRTQDHPFLGHVIESIPPNPDSPDRREREWRYQRADVAKICAERDRARKLKSHEITAPKSKQILSDLEVKAEYGFLRATLKYWREHNCTFLEKELWSDMQLAMTTDGRMKPMHHYKRSELDLIAGRRRAEAKRGRYTDEAGTWVIQKVAHETYKLSVFGITRGRNQIWKRTSIKLRAKQVEMWLDRNCHGSDVWVYHEHDCRRIQAVEAGQEDPGPAIASAPRQGRGRPKKSISREAVRGHAKILREYASKPPYLKEATWHQKRDLELFGAKHGTSKRKLKAAMRYRRRNPNLFMESGDKYSTAQTTSHHKYP